MHTALARRFADARGIGVTRELSRPEWGRYWAELQSAQLVEGFGKQYLDADLTCRRHKAHPQPGQETRPSDTTGNSRTDDGAAPSSASIISVTGLASPLRLAQPPKEVVVHHTVAVCNRLQRQRADEEPTGSREASVPVGRAPAQPQPNPSQGKGLGARAYLVVLSGGQGRN